MCSGFDSVINKRVNMNVGDYVRTKEGYLCKILEIHDEYDDEYLDWNDIGSGRIRKSHIVKSSPNIIDLIEVDDYVNGEKVEAVNILGGFVNTCDNTFYQNKIKSIVTKEQFESMEYKL